MLQSVSYGINELRICYGSMDTINAINIMM